MPEEPVLKDNPWSYLKPFSIEEAFAILQASPSLRKICKKLWRLVDLLLLLPIGKCGISLL